ncbi:MAG: hypothetical protein J6C62_05955 [Clostridia bacterium]|nr:hypothetical protein [Clostridia bacterium]
MEKIYGYKTSDVLELARFIKERKNSSLSSTFERYGALHGKAKGTVRNLYYALAKKSAFDTEFCNKYLDGQPISVSKIVEFSKNEEKALIKDILIAKKGGRSVRSAIMELSNGDGKVALRYQNKFRNAVKNKPELIAEIVKELKDSGQDISPSVIEDNPLSSVSDVQLKKLKSEINGLVGKISLKIRRENELLKNRIAVLERENLKLMNLLYGTKNCSCSKKYLKNNADNQLLN